uniref:Uncharacterized protein n=1 Tax=Heterorhabditis bacteriophora TaxID=37862 RepID=A0A1I7WH87_HETBA
MGPVDVQQVTVSIHTRPIVAGNSLSEDDTRVEETHEVIIKIKIINIYECDMHVIYHKILKYL